MHGVYIPHPNDLLGLVVYGYFAVCFELLTSVLGVAGGLRQSASMDLMVGTLPATPPERTLQQLSFEVSGVAGASTGYGVWPALLPVFFIVFCFVTFCPASSSVAASHGSDVEHNMELK